MNDELASSTWSRQFPHWSFSPVSDFSVKVGLCAFMRVDSTRCSPLHLFATIRVGQRGSAWQWILDRAVGKNCMRASFLCAYFLRWVRL
jgi:hypothetical protein